MTDPHHAVVVLSRALDQAGDALTAVHADQLDLPTPCAAWDVGRLVGHLVVTPKHFLMMLRGEQPDWSATPRPTEPGWAAEFRGHADDLIHHWHQAGDAVDPGQVDWQTAEVAVHTWDLVRATGQTQQLISEVAERGYAFMSANLTDENRGEAFAPAVPVPDDAPVYDRLAGLAGRKVDR
jgi:uncharacterized protein (TIGR03086 family)